MSYDLLIKNAQIHSMDPQLNRYSWLAVKDGKIEALGDGDAPEAGGAEVLDVDGATVLPGLTDCHVHVVNAGIVLIGVDLAGCRNIKEVLDAMAKACAETEGDGWIYGANYVPQNIAEDRYPTCWEMDEISGDHPTIIIAATLHGCAFNTKGKDIVAIPDDLPGVERTDGIPNGIYSSDESSFVAVANALGSLSDDELWEFIKACADNAKSKGATFIHGLFGQFVKDDRDVQLILERGKDLDIEIFPFYQTWDVQKAIDLGLPRVGGCLTLDGALFEYTMANYEPFLTAPALRGVLYHTDEEVYRVVSTAHKNNMQCSMHAVGTRAIDQLIWTYYRVFMEQGKKDLRHRIEHFCLPTEEQIKMAADLGLILSMQPGFTYLWDKEVGGEFERILGRERASGWDPFSRILEAGNIMCGGSDCPVTAVEPLVDIAHCINGDNPCRNIPVTEAIKMYTTNAAYAINNEKRSGSLETGKQADIVIIDRDPYECADDREKLFGMEVLYTIKDGRIIYTGDGVSA